MVRADNHPRRPENYVPLDRFWENRGYRKLEGIIGHITWRDLDEEMDLADRAILASHGRDDALARLQETHRRAFEQAIRDKNEERLSKVAFWMDRAELCLDEMAKLREQCLGWSWEGQRATARGRTADPGPILS